MALTAKQSDFISKIGTYALKYAPIFDVRVVSPIIAQAILESNWGDSKLSASYHNYFGLKCGSKWTGQSVNLATKEEYTAGTVVDITDNFRVYKDMDEGVLGYFEFLFKGRTRYDNLKEVTDPSTYVTNIKNDGYATDSKYIDKVMSIVDTYRLTSFDNKKFTNEWVKVVSDGKSSWYYIEDNAKCAKGKWVKVNSHWYWFGNDGKMATGYQQINGKYYYLMESTAYEGACVITDSSGAVMLLEEK